MKKVLRKTVSIALIACMLLVAVPMLSFAAVSVSNATLTVTGGDVTFAGNAGAADEMLAITVVKCTHNPTLTNGQGVCDLCSLTDPNVASNIKFMDDTLTAADGTYSFEIKGLEDGDYTAFIGGTNIAVADQKKITFSLISKQIKYGDFDRNGNLQSADISILVKYNVGVISFDNDQLLAADMDGSEHIGSNDLSLLVRQQVGKQTDTEFGKDHNLEYVPAGALVMDENNNVIARN